MSRTAQEEIETILSTMTEIVGEYGKDYVYEKRWNPEAIGIGCRYVCNDAPDCLIGKLMIRAGWATIEELKSVEGSRPDWDNKVWPRLTAPARDVLLAAQAAQDGGKTWGQALDRARAEAKIRLSSLQS